MSIRKKLIILCLSIMICGCLIGYLKSISSPYNLSPDNSNKVIGSNSLLDTKQIPTKMEELVSLSDLIIIGEVISGQKLSVEDLSDFIPELKEKKELNIDFTYSCAESKIKVKKVLFGKLKTSNSKIISLKQLGKPNNDDGETKVENGKQMLFILSENTGDKKISYSSVASEKGLFTIDGSNKINSLSKLFLCSKYDERPVTLLETDLKKAINNTKKNK